MLYYFYYLCIISGKCNIGDKETVLVVGVRIRRTVADCNQINQHTKEMMNLWFVFTFKTCNEGMNCYFMVPCT